MSRTALFLSLAAALFASMGLAQERLAEAHVHGASTLQVVISGTEIALSLSIPGADAVGFEHPPADVAQQARLDAALALLSDPLALFGPDGACAVTALAIDDHDFEHDHGHAALEAEYRLACATPVTALTLGFFEAFPAAQSVQAQVLSGQTVFTRQLSAVAPGLDLAP